MATCGLVCLRYVVLYTCVDGLNRFANLTRSVLSEVDGSHIFKRDLRISNLHGEGVVLITEMLVLFGSNPQFLQVGDPFSDLGQHLCSFVSGCMEVRRDCGFVVT